MGLSQRKITALVKRGAKSSESFNEVLQVFEEQLKANAEREAEIRLKWRIEHDLIYVKQYTVKSHMRRMSRPKVIAKRGRLVLVQ